ncbi:hypothetical protein MMC26_002797 [Xylographa opegraphella]|nr:hypothetical protein [Xylographa opegraphella]
MDRIPDLQPIVIPALEHKGNGKLFTCLGNGLQKDEHTFDSYVSSYLPPLKPALTKAGKVKVHQPPFKKQPLSYWKAQCVFRNLPQTGVIAKLQEQLKFSMRGMDPGLAELEKQLNQEFRLKNAAIRDEKWNSMETSEAKAEADPKRFIVEHFLLGQGTLIILQTHQRAQLHEECENHSLAHQSVDAPLNPDGSRPSIDIWIVIGQDRSAVHEKVRDISREATRTRQRIQELEAERTRKLHEDLVSTTCRLGKKKSWDITGSWTVNCPYIEKQWGDGDTDCYLDIVVTTSGGRKQMWAQFDFIVITGIFRFIGPLSSNRHTEKPQSSKPVTLTHARIRRADMEGNDAEDSDEEEEDEEDSEESIEDDEYDGYGEDSESPIPVPEEFYLNTSDHPSLQHPEWNYRWRGEETGEGQIQLYSDKKLCSITFGGPGGTKLVGTFDSDLTGRIDFTGTKTGATADGGDPDDEWQSRSEQAYESARVRRWN